MASASMTALEDLLEQSRQLARGLNDLIHPEVPRIQQTLDEIATSCDAIKAKTQDRDFAKAYVATLSSI